MISGNDNSGPARPDAGVPRTDKTKATLAAVLLGIPILALAWVPSYAKDEPELWGFPFFFWYQFLWVLVTSAATWAAYRLMLAARR
ncbi:DUF3311 domain-containing protein [Nocardioides silvaticus]|uniref:DUF3311 domain-containing protein n=1 Tax=Nocardioides silvaticus TaxID=2201891 RepID=UPI001B86C66C|nr:DUF3311 domain-containing protein [Nocardioides silvaticus]